MICVAIPHPHPPPPLLPMQHVPRVIDLTGEVAFDYVYTLSVVTSELVREG